MPSSIVNSRKICYFFKRKKMIFLWHLLLLFQLLAQVFCQNEPDSKSNPASSNTEAIPDLKDGSQGLKVDAPSTYPSCLHCIQNLAFLDLKATFILLNQQEKFPELSKDGVVDYIKDAQVTIDAYKNTASNYDQLKNSSKIWSEKWMHKMASKTSQNSLAAYCLFFRVVRKLASLIEASEDFNQTLRKNLTAKLLPVLDELPTKKDLLEAAVGFIRLQVVYNDNDNDNDNGKMNSVDLVKGRIMGVETGVTLDPGHCVHLGVVSAKKTKNYPIALQWFDSALHLTRALQKVSSESEIKSKSKSNQVTEFRAKLEREIKDTIQKHNHHFLNIPLKPLKHASKYFGGKLFPSRLTIPAPVLSNFHYTLKKYLREFHSKEKESRGRLFEQIGQFQDEMEHVTKNTFWDPNFLIYTFNQLCAGRDLLFEREKLKLFCWNEQKSSLFYLIGPMKMEFISRGPDVVQVYDVIGPKSIEKLENTLETSEEQFKPGGLVLSNANGTTLKNPLDLYLGTEIKFEVMENITWGQIFVHGKELFQVPREKHKITKYAYSGHFLPHVDFICDGGLCSLQERLANYIVYLSDVPLGGYTVFTRSRVFARPIKGSALFWFNLDGNLIGDVKSSHAGCPSPLGGKVKLGQLVTAVPRFKEWRCPLTDRTSFRIKVNGVE